MNREIRYVECANKKCKSVIGTTEYNQKHYCSNFCGENKKVFRLHRPKQPIQKPIKPPKTSAKVFEERRIKFKKIKDDSGLNNARISEIIGVHRSTVSCYLSGKYNIGDFKWEQIQEIF